MNLIIMTIVDWFTTNVECKIMAKLGYVYHLKINKHQPESGWYKPYNYFHFAKPCWTHGVRYDISSTNNYCSLDYNTIVTNSTEASTFDASKATYV